METSDHCDVPATSSRMNEDPVSIGWIPELVATGNNWQCHCISCAPSGRYTQWIITTVGGHDLNLW